MRYAYKRSVFDGLSRAVDSTLRSVSDLFLQQNPRSLISCSNVADSFTLELTDNTLVSFISIQGNLTSVLAQESVRTLANLERQIKGYLNGGEHFFDWYFSSDSDGIKEEINRVYGNSARRTLTNQGMTAAVDLVEEQVDALAQYCHAERNILVVYTPKGSLTPEQSARVHSAYQDLQKDVPVMDGAIPMATGVEVYLSKHRAVVEEVSHALLACGILSEKVDVHTQLYEIRHAIDADWTAPSWRPRLYGDSQTFQVPEDYKLDYTSLGIPSLPTQLIPRRVENLKSDTCQIGDTIYAPISVELFPSKPMPFQMLFNRLKQEGVPFRYKLSLSSDGLSILSFKEILANGLSLLGGKNNKNLVDVTSNLRQLDDDGDEIVKVQIMFCTWAPADNPKLLSERRSLIAKIFQGWGGGEVANTEGDPIESLLSSVPGATTGSVAPPSAFPLYDGIKLAPYSRPAAIWDEGSSPWRSVDGKLVPYMPYSDKQEAWITLYFGPMGSGKSVALNSDNWALIQHPKNNELPFISIIDVGPGSRGLISTVREFLPKSKKHLAVYKRLKNIKEDSINPGDTLLGLRKPLSNGRATLENFLIYLLKEDGKQTAPEGASELVSMLIDLSYADCADRRTGRVYKAGIDKAVDETLRHLHFESPSKRCLWWDVVDFLTSKGYTYIAGRAQVYAVPYMMNWISLCNDARITTSLNDTHVESTGETIHRYASRKLTAVLNRFPIISRPTQLDISESRIISLDLDEVAKGTGQEASYRTGLMYMLAYGVLTKKFHLGEEHLAEMPMTVGQYDMNYRSFHAKEIEAVKNLPKRICMDEKQRVKGQLIIEDLFDTAIAEGRKHGVEVAQASQLPDDFSAKSIKLATNIKILGSGTPAEAEVVINTFKLNPTLQYHLRNSLRKPTKKGSTFISLMSTNKGWVNQVLMDTKGPRFLWAQNSDSDDAQVRNYIASQIGDVLARRILASIHPVGSIKPEIERKMKQMSVLADRNNFVQEDLEGGEGDVAVTESILKTIADETIKSARAKGLID